MAVPNLVAVEEVQDNGRHLDRLGLVGAPQRGTAGHVQRRLVVVGLFVARSLADASRVEQQVLSVVRAEPDRVVSERGDALPPLLVGL